MDGILGDWSPRGGALGDWSPRSDAGGFNWKGLLDLLGGSGSGTDGAANPLKGLLGASGQSQTPTLGSLPPQPQLPSNPPVQHLIALDLLRQRLGLPPLFGNPA